MAFENSVGFFFGIFMFLILTPEHSSASTSPGNFIYANPLSKHSFTEYSKCVGSYNMNIYSVLNDICSQCYDQYRDPAVYRGCRKDCFTTEYFTSCLKVLGRTEEQEKLAKDISTIHRAPQFV